MPAESLTLDFLHFSYLLWVQVALVNVCLWESEETFLEVVVFFHHVGPGDVNSGRQAWESLGQALLQSFIPL